LRFSSYRSSDFSFFIGIGFLAGVYSSSYTFQASRAALLRF